MKVSERVEFLPPASLKPDKNQPRKTFEDEDIDAMAQTILTQGVINPIEIDEKTTIITGEIRWRGAVKAKVPVVPCRRIYDASPEDRLERQVIENLHKKDLPLVERDAAIYRLYGSGRYGKPGEGRGKAGQGPISNLAKAIGMSPERVYQIVEAQEFRSRTSFVTKEVPTTAIIETAGLPDELRVKVLEKVARGEIVQSASQAEVRQAVQVVKAAPEPVKQRFLEGQLPLEKAVEMTEAVKEAPKPLVEAVVEGKVTVEQAKEAKAIYQQLEAKGKKVEEKMVVAHVEDMAENRRFIEVHRERARTRAEQILSGERAAPQVLVVSEYLAEIEHMLAMVKAWGVPMMMAMGAQEWERARAIFSQIRDHMNWLLEQTPGMVARPVRQEG